MCGIAGLVDSAGEGNDSAARERVRRMTEALAHRGPDGEGLHAWSNAVLGHRRLAIIDLSDAGKQPMLSADGSLGVVFNGAIYNFRDLRNDLESAGYQFRSRTDTEVLIHGYHAWGIRKLVDRLRGMFAFALWDDKLSKLFLVRDRLGVKPLVYSANGSRLAFASTVRALRLAGYADEIDDAAIVDYLEFGYVTDDRAIFKGVSKVPAATIVEWSDGSISSHEYWTPPLVSTGPPPSFDAAVEEAERLFVEAVEKRLYADVRVGALLSGGIDSSLVCWAIRKLGGDVTAYTIGVPGDPWDETADARATAQSLGINHRVLDLSPDDAPEVEELASAYAEPFACASALGMIRVSRAVKSEATVLLTGDGGDDVFLGYPEHRHLWFAEKFARAMPETIAESWINRRQSAPRVGSQGSSDRGTLGRAVSFVNYTAGGIGAVAAAHDGLPMYRANGMLGDRLLDAAVTQRSIPWTARSGRNVLADFLPHDRRGRFVGEYLPKVDGATMFYSLEARSPFLDQELWEFASSLPFDLRLRHGRLKAVLRELARRKLGARVSRGRKRGFSIPVQRWVAGRWRERVEEYFQDALVVREGWIRREPVLEQLRKAATSGWAPKQLWYLYALESWLRSERQLDVHVIDDARDSEAVAPL